MTGLQYRGRVPDTDFSVLHKKWADDNYDLVKVDAAFVNNAVATEGIPLVSQTYVDNQDNLREKITAVDTADLGYLLATVLGTASGVASIGADGYVPSAQLPTLTTERKPFVVNATEVLMTGTHEVTTLNNKEYRAANLTITDPGFPYIPLFFAYVSGGSLNGVQPSRMLGTGSYGQISVLRSDNLKYAWTLCNSKKALDTFCAMPFADTTINPTVLPPLYGTTQWSLWLGLWSGSTFTFTPTGFRFFAFVWPGF